MGKKTNDDWKSIKIIQLVKHKLFEFDSSTDTQNCCLFIHIYVLCNSQ